MNWNGLSVDFVYVGSALLLVATLAAALTVTAYQLNRINPQLAGAVIGALISLIVLECVPLLT
ncbi:hypothetical protein [Burkholderia sp. L27(2015)]|jgi:hypothetical protein|uniref:hypothetical protein n=1 Tax=Burkholderia sp. L27(2015) TaxID=1641858 RepID=UPI00131CF493|nr:hypothetical protein [Burkholderia sp. L27(2015)]